MNTILKNWKLISGAGLTIAVVVLFFLLKDANKDKDELQSNNTELKKELDKSTLYGDVMRNEYNKLSDSKTHQETAFKEEKFKIIKDYTKKLQKKPKIVYRDAPSDTEPIITVNPTTSTKTLSDAFKTDILTMDYKIHYKGEILGTEFYPTIKQKVITNSNIVYEDKPYPVFKYIKKAQFGIMYNYGFSNNLTIHDFNIIYKSKTNLGVNFGMLMINNKALENDMEYVPKVGVSIWF